MRERTALVIRGADIIDPYRSQTSRDEDVWVVDGHIATQPPSGADWEVVQARGLWLVPRLTDMHVHFREPGQTWKETIASGSRAAAMGGLSQVAVMPNTVPVTDTPELVEWVVQRGRAMGLVRIIPIGAITRRSDGQDLADLGRMQRAGAMAFSDDGRPVGSARLMRAALTYAKGLAVPIINHAEDLTLSEAGSAQEGGPSQRLGLGGVPEAAESIMVWRDVILAGLTGAALHVAHVSAQESLAAIDYARRCHYPVTAEVTPHHLLLSDAALLEWQYNPVTKVNPPLRPEATRQRLVEAVTAGLIPVMASDHAPHHRDDKALPYADAPYGISGLETLVAGLITALIASGLMAPVDALALLTRGPDRVLGIGYAGLVPGAPADLTLIDPKAVWRVDPTRFVSLGKNTPLEGIQLTGRPVATMLDGRFTMREGSVLDAGIS